MNHRENLIDFAKKFYRADIGRRNYNAMVSVKLDMIAYLCGACPNMGIAEAYKLVKECADEAFGFEEIT